MSASQSSTAAEVGLVLVTGGDGYIGTHLVSLLLKRGYKVRAAVMDVKSPSCSHLKEWASSGLPVSMTAANLLREEDWPAAVDGCSHVIHVASPILLNEPEDPNVLVAPALLGTKAVLKAAAAAGVKRVVQTSSLAAITSSRKELKASEKKVADETWWTDPESANAYGKAKTSAERAAWEFIRGPDSNGMELVTICPGIVFGPSLTGNMSVSLDAAARVLRDEMKAVPDICFPAVDVRDVATAHVLALERADVAFERFMLVNETVSYLELCQHIAPAFRAWGYTICTRPLPNWLAIAVSYVDPTLKSLRYSLGVRAQYDGSKSRAKLGIEQYRCVRHAFMEMAVSAVVHGVIPKTPAFRHAESLPSILQDLPTAQQLKGQQQAAQ